MPVLLPSSPAPRMVSLDYVSQGMVLEGATDQRLNRLGDRYAYKVTLPSRASGAALDVYAQRLRKALTDGAIMAVLQPGLEIGDPGNPQIDGGGQLGLILSLTGVRPGYVIRDGQAFSIVHNGRRYLHTSDGTFGADGNGRVRIVITPMLRISPADRATCEFAEPKIEGFLTVNAIGIGHTRGRSEISEFTIKEAR